MKIFKALFNHEYKEVEKFKKIADEIVLLEDEYSKLTDKQLKNKTLEFKKRLEEGEILEWYTTVDRNLEDDFAEEYPITLRFTILSVIDRRIIRTKLEIIDEVYGYHRCKFSGVYYEEDRFKEFLMESRKKTVDYRIQQALKILRTEFKDYLPLLPFMFQLYMNVRN